MNAASKTPVEETKNSDADRLEQEKMEFAPEDKDEFTRRFKNPLIKRAFNIDAADESADMPAITLPMVLAWQHQQVVCYVIGGALALVGYIRQRYLYPGGELHLKAKWVRYSMNTRLCIS